MTNELVPKFQQVFQGHESIDIDNSVMLEGNHPVLTDPSLYQMSRDLIKQLPVANYDFLRALLSHLKRISQNYEINKMGINNLSLVWRPTIQFGGTLFVFLTFHSDTLFSEDRPKGAAALVHPVRVSSLSHQSDVIEQLAAEDVTENVVNVASNSNEQVGPTEQEDNCFDDKYGANEPVEIVKENYHVDPQQSVVSQEDYNRDSEHLSVPVKPKRHAKIPSGAELAEFPIDASDNEEDGSILQEYIAELEKPEFAQEIAAIEPEIGSQISTEEAKTEMTVKGSRGNISSSIASLSLSQKLHHDIKEAPVIDHDKSLPIVDNYKRYSSKPSVRPSNENLLNPIGYDTEQSAPMDENDPLSDNYKHHSAKLSVRPPNDNSHKSYGYESQPDSQHSSRSTSPEQFNDDAEIDGPLPPMLKPRRVRH